MTTHGRITIEELSKDLDMLAGQLQEAVATGNCDLPHPWSFEDWITAYRLLYVHRRKLNLGFDRVKGEGG